MDSIGLFIFLFINMITLHFNLAETGDDLAVQDSHVEANSILHPVFRRFKWKDLNGKPVRRSGRQHTSETLGSDDERDQEDQENVDAQARAVYWIPTTCDPMIERGYTCLGCGESLHCMGGGFALKAICMGRRPFCNNGVCSSARGEKCNKNEDALAVQAAAVPPNATASDVPGASIAPELSAPVQVLGAQKVPTVQELLMHKLPVLHDLPDVHELSDEQNSSNLQELAEVQTLPDIPLSQDETVVAGARRI